MLGYFVFVMRAWIKATVAELPLHSVIMPPLVDILASLNGPPRLPVRDHNKISTVTFWFW